MTTPTPSHMDRIRQDIQGMHAYAVQDSRGLIKLDAMENPYTLSADLQAALGARLGALAINRYPGVRMEDLKAALKAYAQPPAGFDLMLGNGSDELISLLAMAVCKADGPREAILSPMPGFVMYPMSAQFQHLQFVGVDLTADFELDLPAMLAAIEKHQPAVTYIAYPNNPTANLWDGAAIEQIVLAAKAIGGMVVLDEAYQPFACTSWLGLAGHHDHVLVMRTLSKFGLAGVRLGYMMGPMDLIAQIDKLRPPYNVSVLNAECALFALEHESVFAAQAEAIRAERKRIFKALDDVEGLRTYKSDANMILVKIGDAKTADEVFAGMKQRGVLIKNVSKLHPLLANCLRLTVGTSDENTAMLAALKESL
jgi:histidinol-phosphate aminotransferase